MANSRVFEWACEALEQATTFDRLESRGTLRLALKSSGLEAREVTCSQMAAVLERVLPTELELRGVTDCKPICERLAQKLSASNFDEKSSDDSPENVFARLGGN